MNGTEYWSFAKTAYFKEIFGCRIQAGLLSLTF